MVILPQVLLTSIRALEFASFTVHLVEKVKKPTENIDVVHQYPYYFLCFKTVSYNMAMKAPMCKQASHSHYFIANSFAHVCRNQQRSRECSYRRLMLTLEEYLLPSETHEFSGRPMTTDLQLGWFYPWDLEGGAGGDTVFSDSPAAYFISHSVLSYNVFSRKFSYKSCCCCG